MRIGVPKEIKNHEYRVALTPPSAAEPALPAEFMPEPLRSVPVLLR